MTEKGIPTPVDALTPKSRVFDLTNLDAQTRVDILNSLPDEALNSGDKIIGLQSWQEVKFISDILIARIVQTTSLAPNEQPAFRKAPDLVKTFKQHDMENGFYGKSRDFEVTMRDTDLSFVRTGRKKANNPALARTFELARRLHSVVLPSEGSVASTICTISLVSEKTESESEVYGYKEPKIHFFSGTVALKDLDSQALNLIRQSRKSIAAIGGNTFQRPGSRRGRKNPI